MGKREDLKEEIIANIERLVGQRSDLEAEVKRLQESLTSAEEKLSLIIGEKEALIEQNKVLKLAKTLSTDDGEDNSQVRNRVNELVREIDKCIALLNK